MENRLDDEMISELSRFMRVFDYLTKTQDVFKDHPEFVNAYIKQKEQLEHLTNQLTKEEMDIVLERYKEDQEYLKKFPDSPASADENEYLLLHEKNTEVQKITEPDNTAIRTALWRALHVQIDAEPHILKDEIGLKLIAPPADWQQRPDMKFTKRLRAAIVARSRFIEDLIIEQNKQGINQYVILGAGLDTFAQRRPAIASKLQIYEIDQPGTLTWKQQRLVELGFDVPGYLHFVPVNFETSSWWNELVKAGFDPSKPAVVVCTGVTLYLTKEAIVSTLNQISTFTQGSKLAMTFYLPMELLDEEDKPMQEIGEKGARATGTPFISFFTPTEILTLARETGFKEAKALSTKDMEQLYFAGRTDNLLPASGEVFLLTTT